MWKDPINVQVISKHTLEVFFEDGLSGKIIFKPSRFRGVFKSLKNEEILRMYLLIGKSELSLGKMVWI